MKADKPMDPFVKFVGMLSELGRDPKSQTKIKKVKKFIEDNFCGPRYEYAMYQLFESINDLDSARISILNAFKLTNDKNQKYDGFISVYSVMYIDINIKLTNYNFCIDLIEIITSILNFKKIEYDENIFIMQKSFCLEKLKRTKEAINIINELDDPIFLGFPEHMRYDPDWAAMIKNSIYAANFLRDSQP